jgi:hypothetical protein
MFLGRFRQVISANQKFKKQFEIMASGSITIKVHAERPFQASESDDSRLRVRNGLLA